MKQMKIAVRYQSRGGNSKAAAEVIAEAAGVKAERIDIPINEPIDILFVGGGVYAWTIDKNLKAFLHSIDPKSVKTLAAFTTSGLFGCTGTIKAIAKAKGINTSGIHLPLRMGFHNYFGAIGYATLSDKQKGLLNGFVEKVIEFETTQ